MGERAKPQFGALLRQMRLTAGLTQEALADLSGLSVRGISDLERGRRRSPRMDTIQMLANALHLDDTEQSSLILASRTLLQTPPSEHVASSAAGFRKRHHNLPHSLTSLVGRIDEVASISATILRPETRLLTLNGPGGIGKTRLALELAEELTHAFAGGAHFVTLVPLNSPDLVMPAIAEALGIHEADSVSLQTTLAARLHDAEILLLLDNFEHVLEAATAVQELLASCPNLKVVATSRAPLHVRMEHIYAVEPLDLPDPGDATTLADLQRFDALTLFVDRARVAEATFQPANEHVPDIAEICRKLDGLPLAIELAAARLRVVSVGELLDMLGNTLPVLTDGARDLPERHQTLQNTINWSYSLLSSTDQRLFRHLAVFAGGWTLDAARTVANGPADRSTEPDILNSIAHIVDHSLVRRVTVAAGVTRYGMLQTIREFGAEQLAAHSEESDVRRRHAHYFLGYVENLKQEFSTTDDPECLNLVAGEYDNLRIALGWFITQQNATGALVLCSALSSFWTLRGYLSEARARVSEALAIPDPTPGPERAQALYTGCLLACHQNDLEHAHQLATESLTLSRTLENDTCIVTALLGLGLVAQLREDYEQASQSYEDGITLARPLAHPKLAVIIGNLAQVQFHLGNVERSIELLGECIDFDRATGGIPLIGVHLTDLGLVLLERDDVQPAHDAFSEALPIHQAVGNTRMIIVTLEGFAGVEVKRGNAARAATLYGAGEALRTRNAYPQQEPDRWSYRTYLKRIRRVLGDDQFEELLASGRSMPVNDAIALALAPTPSTTPDNADAVTCDTPGL